MTLGKQSMASLLLLWTLASGASAAPPAIKLSCPEGTTQKTLPNKCGDTVTCVSNDPDHPSYSSIPVLELYPTGMKRAESTLVGGRQRVGPWTIWYPNGARRYEARFGRAGLDGPATEWYPDGRKRAEVTYVEGRLDGVARLLPL
jgi:antitoxin component YwqK of YwqJK toxin-antitoxin module